MSIDLSKAKIGDKFRTRAGYVVELKDTILYLGDDVYRLTSPKAFVCVFQNGKIYKDNKESEFDLVEQVFDKGDLLDNNISVENRGLAIVEMAKSEREEAKEFGAIIQNLPHIVEQPKEDNPELQRRQEVVELADRIFTEKYLQEWYQYLIDNKTTKTDYVTYIFEWAEKFVNAKDKYLKEGKL